MKLLCGHYWKTNERQAPFKIMVLKQKCLKCGKERVVFEEELEYGSGALKRILKALKLGRVNGQLKT